MSPSAAPVDPSQLAGLVISWSGLVLAAFTLLVAVLTILFVVAGFLGIREVRNIRQIRSELDEQIRQVVDEGRAAVKGAEGLSGQAQRLIDREGAAIEQADARARRVEELFAEWETRFNELDARVTRQVEVGHLFTEGEDAYRTGRFEKAVEYLSRAAELDPDNARIHYRLGRSLTNLGDDETAFAQLERALELGMPAGQVERGLAQAYRYADPATARSYAEEAVACAADDAHNWNCLGLILRDGGDFTGSVQAHAKAHEVSPNQATSLFYLALLEAKAHQYPRAQEHARQATDKANAQERRDQLKLVWTALIRWTNHVLHGQYTEADQEAENLRRAVSSRRRAREVTEHVEFLLRALGREEFRDRYIHEIEDYWFGRAA